MSVGRKLPNKTLMTRRYIISYCLIFDHHRIFNNIVCMYSVLYNTIIVVSSIYGIVNGKTYSISCPLRTWWTFIFLYRKSYLRTQIVLRSYSTRMIFIINLTGAIVSVFDMMYLCTYISRYEIKFYCWKKPYDEMVWMWNAYLLLNLLSLDSCVTYMGVVNLIRRLRCE